VLSEVDRVCNRIALLRKGQLVLFSSVEEIRGVAARRVRVSFTKDVDGATSLPAGHEIVEMKPRAWELRVEGPLGPLLGVLNAFPVADIRVEEPRLEDVLVKYYREGAQ